MKNERWKMKDEGWRMKDEGWRMKDEGWVMRDEEWWMKNEALRLGVAWDWRIFEWWEVRNKTETIKTFLVFLLNLVSGIESTGIDCTVYMVTTVLDILQIALCTVNCTVARYINSVWNCKRMDRICFFFILHQIQFKFFRTFERM